MSSISIVNIALKNAFYETEIFIINSDMGAWKKQIGLGIASAKDLPLPAYGAVYD